MFNKDRSGKSIILLVIVICIMTFALLFISRLFNNSGDNRAEEEAFKLSVYGYYLEIEDYKNKMIDQNNYNEQDFNVCGTELKSVIPDIVETDMSKFKIEHGKLVYIGVDEKERQWTQEVKI